MCLVIALLPSIPLSILVRNLLDKSFNVGLSDTMEEALGGGITVSRKHLEELHLDFEREVDSVIAFFSGSQPDSSRIASLLSNPAGAPGIDGFIMSVEARPDTLRSVSPPLPRALARYYSDPLFADLIGDSTVIERATSAIHPNLVFYETENRTVQFAHWSPPGRAGPLLFYKRTDPEFIAGAEQLLLGRRLFAQLRLSQSRLSRSFFYPFISIYVIILVLSLLVAFFMSERLAAPIRQLVAATSAVAGGDWHIQLKQKTGGEIGNLVDSFNRMVKRLDTQRRRLIDLEKMASWREIGRHLAHEIKNPLLPIRLTVQEIKDQYTGEDEHYRELLSESVRVVEDELHHLQSLVKEFSAFAKMPGLKPVLGSIDQLVRDVARLYPQAEVSISADSDLPQSVFDPDQMRRVLVNLFDNSLSVLPDLAQAEVEIQIRSDGDHLVLTFADNGPGISAGNMEKIFDPYFSTRKDGTGLGLAVVKNIILLHDGTIEAQSRKNEGATFTIRLPLKGPAGSPDAKTGDSYGSIADANRSSKDKAEDNGIV
jgi:nitrogen fixation/metabolism regulation signal transduction histidine kinase